MLLAFLLCNSWFVLTSPPTPHPVYSVLIHEIMADPTPAVGLPEYEYVEIRNVSNETVNLSGWTLQTATTTGRFPENSFLNPNALAILCTAGAVPHFEPYGQVIRIISFPALPNESGKLELKNAAGHTVHALEYHKSWYPNVLKAEGGWSLEMKDPTQPCEEKNNWAASTQLAGGTPGTLNAVGEKLQQTTTLVPQFAVAEAPTLVNIHFNAPLSPFQPLMPHQFSLENTNHVIEEVKLVEPFFKQVQLKLNLPLVTGRAYTLEIKNLKGCASVESRDFFVKTGIAGQPMEQDILLNELLFHPVSGGSDYIELVNVSEKVLPLNALFLAAKSSTGNIGTAVKLKEEPALFFPNDHLVFTPDTAFIQSAYKVENPGWLHVLDRLPGMSNSSGTILLMNAAGEIIDELSYDHRWHFSLLSEKAGIALERISLSAATQDAGNWTSAASSSGFGTPTAPNSQRSGPEATNQVVQLSSTLLSPDNDGRDDFLFITYTTASTGWLANITVYNLAGYPVRELVKNAVLGRSGQFRFDGLNNKGAVLPNGIYIIRTDIHNLKGKTQGFKQAITLTSRF